jgi:hypothetical protein
MRSFYLIILAALGTCTVALISCEKESPTPPLPTTRSQAVNIPPLAYAGYDILLVTPANSCTLAGSAIDDQRNIEKYLWKQISGPNSSIIESPDSIKTNVSNLEKGTYEFELSVTDKGGLNDKDTVIVRLREAATPGSGEVIVNNLKWECPMGCSVLINCFPCLVPINQPFKVYLSKANLNQWIEVVPEAKWTANDIYSYGIGNNNLWVYTNDEEGNVDVKITY